MSVICIKLKKKTISTSTNTQLEATYICRKLFQQQRDNVVPTTHSGGQTTISII